MTTFPGSPKTLRGAILGYDIFNPILISGLTFQYNPDSMTRTLQAQSASGEGAHSEALRLGGAPIETISVDIELDASDDLEQATSNHDLIVTHGLYPRLSALEMLIYPKSALVIANTILLATGTLEMVPPLAPLTLFVWGIKRILPVRITDFSITEQAYDVNLNPIRAQVRLGMRVLSYNDLSITNPAYYLYLANQISKEAFALVNEFTGGIQFDQMINIKNTF